MFNKKFYSLISLLLFSSSLAAGPYTIPKTYIGGDTLTAAELNADNTAIKAAVDDNDGRITSNAGNISTNTTDITALEVQNAGLVSGCGAGTSIRSVATDGSVTCEIDDDSLNTLSCTTGQTATWTGSSWGCTTQVTKYININAYSSNLRGSAVFTFGVGDDGAIVFPDAGSPQLDYNFFLPYDYVAGTTVTLEVIWRSTGTTGNVGLRQNWGAYQRVGSTSTNLGGSNSALINQTAVGMVHLSELPFTSTGLLPGDSISHGIWRSETSDTSVDNIIIGGLRIKYTANK